MFFTLMFSKQFSFVLGGTAYKLSAGNLYFMNQIKRKKKKTRKLCLYDTGDAPCPKPVLTPCPILTHDPQHIQSILETNV